MNTSPHYEQIGGEAGIRALVDRFYDIMDTAPEATAVRALHATNLKVSRDKLFMYLSGWLGGPPLYEDKFGHPRLRMRHFPFAIGVRERDEWLWCMERAIEQHEMPDALRTELVAKLRNVAWHMQNQPG